MIIATLLTAITFPHAEEHIYITGYRTWHGSGGDGGGGGGWGGGGGGGSGCIPQKGNCFEDREGEPSDMSGTGDPEADLELAWWWKRKPNDFKPKTQNIPCESGFTRDDAPEPGDHSAQEYLLMREQIMKSEIFGLVRKVPGTPIQVIYSDGAVQMWATVANSLWVTPISPASAPNPAQRPDCSGVA